MSSGDNTTWDNAWGNSAGHIVDGQLNIDANKIYFDGAWQNIVPVEHNHNNTGPVSYTYNDDSVKMDGIVEVIDEILAAIQPVIDIGSMKKIARKLEKVRNQQNHWHVFNNPGPMIREFDKNYSKPELKIELEEDLFEL